MSAKLAPCLSICRRVGNSCMQMSPAPHGWMDSYRDFIVSLSGCRLFGQAERSLNFLFAVICDMPKWNNVAERTYLTGHFHLRRYPVTGSR